MLKICRALLMAASCAIGLWVASPALADPLKIRVGWISVPADLTPILFAKEGVARNNGKSYVLEPVYFSSSSVEIQALATGDIDIAAMNFATFTAAIQNAGLSDLRVLADVIQDGTGNSFSLQFMVRKDSPIQKVSDLKGKVLATIGIGTGAHTGMLASLNKAGLKDRVDYTVIETPYPTMKSILKDRKADLIAVTTGFAVDPELNEFARVLFKQKDGMGPSELDFWGARSGYVSKNREALVDFLEDTVRANRWYLDPANKKEAVEIIAKATKIPAERLSAWVFTESQDFYRDPWLAVNLPVLQSNVDFLREIGLAKAPIAVDKYADLSLLKDAVARVKQDGAR